MQVKFLVGFSDYETLELNEEQLDKLLHYLLNTKGNIYQNQSFVAALKTNKPITEENMDLYNWKGLLEK